MVATGTIMNKDRFLVAHVYQVPFHCRTGIEISNYIIIENSLDTSDCYTFGK